mmetsp:Transcript_65664/g.80378  ORF Transcript_65664/g.80378 Transcript_65664/m.80378 type:complete len:81 (-) Transcript_65664:923-1165(-)
MKTQHINITTVVSNTIISGFAIGDCVCLPESGIDAIVGDTVGVSVDDIVEIVGFVDGNWVDFVGAFVGYNIGLFVGGFVN